MSDRNKPLSTRFNEIGNHHSIMHWSPISRQRSFAIIWITYTPHRLFWRCVGINCLDSLLKRVKIMRPEPQNDTIHNKIRFDLNGFLSVAKILSQKGAWLCKGGRTIGSARLSKVRHFFSRNPLNPLGRSGHETLAPQFRQICSKI